MLLILNTDNITLVFSKCCKLCNVIVNPRQETIRTEINVLVIHNYGVRITSRFIHWYSEYFLFQAPLKMRGLDAHNYSCI